MDWEFEGLWAKARLFAERALALDREDPLFALWMVLALEVLARSAIAHVHPALLADPREGPDHLLYAFGYSTTDNPRSIPMKTVIGRLQAINPDFTPDLAKVTTALIERRNAEFHSGHPSFDDYPTRLWLADYYALCDVVLRGMGQDLPTYIGEEEAEVALQMIEAREQELRTEVEIALAEARERFEALAQDEISVRATSPFTAQRYSLATITAEAPCPSCGSAGQVEGKRIRTLEPHALDDMIVRGEVGLPIAFRCRVCLLELDGHSALHAAGAGGQFTVEEYYDPADFFGIEFDPSDYYGDEYGNE